MRLRILEAAALEIEVHGASFSMDGLAKRLNISKRTLYEHFKSKNEIIETLLTEKIRSIYEQHQVLLADETLDCRTKLLRFFSVKSKVFNPLNGKHIREMFDKMPFLIERIMSVGRADWEQLENYLQAEKARGNLRNVNIQVLIFMLQGIVDKLMYDSASDLDECWGYLTKAVNMVLDGILVESEEQKK